jgi:hypothetical protein
MADNAMSSDSECERESLDNGEKSVREHINKRSRFALSVMFVFSGVTGAFVADYDISNHSPNEEIQAVGDYHLLKLRSVNSPDVRHLEESWFDYNNDKYTDEILVQVAANPESDMESNWRLYDSDGDGWFERIELTFQGPDHKGSIALEGVGRPGGGTPSVKLFIQPSDPKLGPIVYVDKTLGGSLMRMLDETSAGLHDDLRHDVGE